MLFTAVVGIMVNQSGDSYSTKVDRETELEDGIISKSGYMLFLDSSNGFISDEKKKALSKKKAEVDL